MHRPETPQRPSQQSSFDEHDVPVAPQAVHSFAAPHVVPVQQSFSYRHFPPALLQPAHCPLLHTPVQQSDPCEQLVPEFTPTHCTQFCPTQNGASAQQSADPLHASPGTVQVTQVCEDPQT